VSKRPLDLHYAREKLGLAVQSLDDQELRRELGIRRLLAEAFLAYLQRIGDATPPRALRREWSAVFDVDGAIDELSGLQLERLEKAIRALAAAVEAAVRRGQA
jgi:hypothetical protein